jgi:hypothetical protein
MENKMKTMRKIRNISFRCPMKVNTTNMINYDENAIRKAYFKTLANEYQVELTNFYYKNYTLFMNDAKASNGIFKDEKKIHKNKTKIFLLSTRNFFECCERS